jgi:hypothetical protein
MSTRSILKTVHIKDSKSARRLASALENASKKKCREVVYSRAVSTAARDEIKAMFHGKD